MELSTYESRRSPRFTLRRRVWCEGDHITLYLQSQNISARGLFLQTATPLPVGSRAHMSMRIDDVEMVGEIEIVWVAGREAPVPGMGVRLLEIREGAAAFDELLAQAARPPSRVRTPNVG